MSEGANGSVHGMIPVGGIQSAGVVSVETKWTACVGVVKARGANHWMQCVVWDDGRSILGV